MFGLSYIYQRPILGDNPKPHKILLKSTALFMELHFSLKSTALFIEKHCACHGVVLFTEKHCTFHEKHCAFHETALFTEKQQKQLIQHRSLIMTWCFIEYRGKANWVYLTFWCYLVVHVCVNGACIHTY